MTILKNRPISHDIIRDRCVSFISKLLNEQKNTIDADADFERLGLDSAMAVAMIFDLEEWLEMELSPSLLFDHTNINQLSAHLAAEAVKQNPASGDAPAVVASR